MDVNRRRRAAGRRMVIAGTACGLLLALLLVACGAGPAPPLRIGTSLWTGYDPFFLARDNGYFSAGAARLVEYTSTTESNRAFRNGALDAAMMTLTEAIKLKRIGVDLKVVLIIDISNGGDCILAKPGITSLAGLKGRAVGVETTSIGDFVIARALKTVGLRPADVKVVPLEVSEHERAFSSNQIDAVVTYEPVRTKLLAAGAVKLFDSSQVPGEIVDVLVIRSELLPRRVAQLSEVFRGWFRVLDDIGRGTPGTIHRLAEREHISDEEFRASLGGVRLPTLAENRLLLDAQSPMLLDPARRLLEVMLEIGVLDGGVDVRSLLDGATLAGLAR